ncbi:hypothetical protein K438DRAFT_1842205 [Mycena galopus ATCC 62051]|nr:hypothetical protein K438DRAFT_1842205 [Mycena galopus ATCC 62051]
MKLARRLVQNFEGREDEDHKEDRPAPKDALGKVLALVKQMLYVLRDWRPHRLILPRTVRVVFQHQPRL